MSVQEALEFDPPPVLEASPFRKFTRAEWAELRGGVEIPLTGEELARLSGLIERISHEEVEDIYLPVAKLVSYYVSAAQELHSATAKFFNKRGDKTPFGLPWASISLGNRALSVCTHAGA